MANPQTIREYLVGIGFDVDKNAWRQLEDHLKRADQKMEKFSMAVARNFTIAGGVATTALATIAGATVGVLTSVANQDLRYQLLARRMFMTTEATKKMKMATDALGYSLEEIIWGPPELAERYRALIKDQDRMFRYLGSDGGEKAFRAVRDIEFQFTRMVPALQILGMKLTTDIIEKLTGTHSVEDAIKSITGYVDKFEDSIPAISRAITDKLAPAIKGVYDWTKATVGLVESSPTLQKMIQGGLIGGAAGFAVGGVGVVPGAVIGAGAGLLSAATDPAWQKYQADWMQKSNQGQFKLWAIQAAAKYHLPPAEFMAMLSVESGTRKGWNPNAYNPSSGAMGLGQFLPGTARQYGLTNPYDPQANIEASAHYMSDLMTQFGSFDAARKHYAGFVNKDPSADIAEIHRRAQQYKPSLEGMRTDEMGGRYQPQSYKIQINVDRDPSKLKDDIRRAVVQVISEHEHRAGQLAFARAQGVS